MQNKDNLLVPAEGNPLISANGDDSKVYEAIRNALAEARTRVAVAVNVAMVSAVALSLVVPH